MEVRGANASLATESSRFQEAKMTRDELNRELRMHSASWQAVVIVYGGMVGALVLSAMAIV